MNKTQYRKSLDKVIETCKKAYPRHNLEGHLIPVVNVAMDLCKRFNAKRHIVEPAAYLHDIGRVKFDYLKAIGIGHELSGYHYSRFLLGMFGYSKNDCDRISHAVLCHSGKSGKYKSESIEDEIIINADGISHIEQYLYLLAIYYSSHGRNYVAAKKWTINKIKHSYNTKLTLPGSKKRVEKIYRTALKELSN